MNIKLKKWDNCYTFMLKFLDIFNKYCEIDSNDFINLFEKDYNLKSFNNNDIIVWEDINGENAYGNRELKEGVLVSRKYDSTIHFGVVYLDHYLIDVTFVDNYNVIRIREISELNFTNKDSNVFVIRYQYET